MNPNNGPFRYYKPKPTNLKCPYCNSSVNLIAFKNDFIDDHKFKCSNFNCEYEEY